MIKNFGIAAASTLAALLASQDALASVKIIDGHYCSNNCKGQSDCGGMGNQNGCHGSNDCKGQGWKDVSGKKECIKVGGKWTKAPANASALEEGSTSESSTTPAIDSNKSEKKMSRENKITKSTKGAKKRTKNKLTLKINLFQKALNSFHLKFYCS